MKRGDLIAYRPDLVRDHRVSPGLLFLVRRTEEENDWVYVFDRPGPYQKSLMVIVSEADSGELVDV